MMVALNILLSLSLALVVTILVVLILVRQPRMRRGVAFYSPVVFLLVATVGLWSQESEMTQGAGHWVATVVAGLIVLLTALAVRPRQPRLRLLTSDGGGRQSGTIERDVRR